MRKKKRAKFHRFLDESVFDKHLDRAYPAFDKILELTSEFCQKYLNDEYRELCEDLTWAVYEEGLPIESGKPNSWASGIVHALGWVNFLHDPSQSPHMSSSEIARGFGVSQGTMIMKSRIIRDEFDLIQLDPDWCLPSRIKDNPLVWMLSVNGFVMDIRVAPREAQEEAYRIGLIPYIPAEKQKPKPQSDAEPNVIKFPAGQNGIFKPKTLNRQKDDESTLFDASER